MSEPQTKTCQSCKNPFVIEPEDFDFYKKIDVPPPTWCPDCRRQRRFTFRNERTLYRRTCGLCGARILSNYSESAAATIYCNSCWWGDGWEGLEYGTPFDETRPFFLQYAELVRRVPQLNLWAFTNASSEYANYTAYCKDVYLSYSILYSEDVLYSSHVDKSFHCVDCYKTIDSQYCYETVNSQRCYESKYLLYSKDCMNSSFLYNCANCDSCFMCANLRNKQYCIRGAQYSKESYAVELAKLGVNTTTGIAALRHEFTELIRSSLRKYANLIQTVDSTGDNLVNAKNAKNTFDSENVENIRYSWRLSNFKDAYDISGAIDSELCYEVVVGGDKNYGCKFYAHGKGMRNVTFAQFCPEASNCFGCVGIKNKQYCILNTQYTKEEYEALVSKIREHMNTMPYVDRKGRVYRYGEFFPPELSPFAYNETVAQESFPLSEEQALEAGYTWKDPDTKEYTVTKAALDLPNASAAIPDAIIDDVIGCAHGGACLEQCTTAFRIVPQELEFYRRMGLPLPHLCPNCRHYERLKLKNPLKTWRRTCMCSGKESSNGTYTNTVSHDHGIEACTNEFETSFAPDRTETVYCEQCFNAEVI